MRLMIPVLAASFLLASPLGAPPTLAGPEPAPAAVLAGAWTEPVEGLGERVVVALLLRPGAEARRVWVVLGVRGEEDGPGGYGTFPAGSWREVDVEPGEILLLRRTAAAPSTPVLVAERRYEKDLDVHALIDGDLPTDVILFERVGGEPAVRLDRHVVKIGEKVEATVATPTDDGFFREETLEIVRVPRRLPLDGDDPDSPLGYVTTTPREAPAFRVLEGDEGEGRIRSHFTDPRCAWAERHVGWMKDLWIEEYLHTAPLRVVLDTSTVKAPGRVSDLWRGYGAFTVESIWPNGFGGSSSNLDIPCLLVVPKDTRERTREL